MRLQYFCSSWCCLVFICLFCILVWESVRSLTCQPSQLVQIGKVQLLACLHCHCRLPRPHLHCKYQLRFEEHSNYVRCIKNRHGRETNFTILNASAIYFHHYCDVTTNSRKSICHDVLNYKMTDFSSYIPNFFPMQPSFATKIATKLLH